MNCISIGNIPVVLLNVQKLQQQVFNNLAENYIGEHLKIFLQLNIFKIGFKKHETITPYFVSILHQISEPVQIAWLVES